MGVLVAFHPFLRYGLPRSSEAWSHLENLDRIPSALQAANFGRMLKLFDYQQHYAKYPLFYISARAFGINSPKEAAAFSAILFSLLPLLYYLLVRTELPVKAATAASVVLATTSAFVYTMNFFSGGEPLAMVVMLVGLLLHRRLRPLAALPFYVMVIFLHPITSTYLWLLLILRSGLVEMPTRKTEEAFTTLAFAIPLLVWFLFQISLGLPLGDYMVASLGVVIFAFLFIVASALSIAMLLRDRYTSLGRILSGLRDLLARRLPLAVIVLEACLLLLLLVVGAPGTEQKLELGMLVFYAPLLLIIPLCLVRGQRLGGLALEFLMTFLLLVALGVLLLPKAIPFYRLAPYGALALGILVGPVIERHRVRMLVPILVMGLAATVYPGPTNYFGFDEQYYPSELSGVRMAENLTLTGRILTDVRMEDFSRYLSGETAVPEAAVLDVRSRDLVLITSQMRYMGFYPEGPEWFRTPYRLNMEPLERASDRLFDNARVQLLLLPSGEIKVHEAID
jgi:hypothetical protein